MVIIEEVVKAAAGNKENRKEVIILLLEQRGADVVIIDEVVKAVAGNEGNGEEVMMLLLEQRGADVVIIDEVVKAAVGNEGNGEEVMMLLLKQRRPDIVITEEVVKAAVTSGQENVLKLFEDYFEISVSKEQWSIAQFYSAAKFGKEETIQKLLRDGVKPDHKNIRHVTPLGIAATNGHRKAVEVLIATNLVDVNSKSIAGRSPIFWAANGHKDIVKLLLQAGADPNIIDEDGNTPFSTAKQGGFHEIERMIAGQ